MFIYAVVGLLVLYVLSHHFLQKIRNLPPTPFPTLPIIGHLHLIKKPLHRCLTNISNQYGPVILLQLGSRRVLVVSSPSAAEDCFTTNDIIFANRPRLLTIKYLGYNFRSLAGSPYGEHWRNLRRICSLQILSNHRLQLSSGIRSEEVNSLLHRLVNSKNEAVNLRSVLFELMLNVMMRMIAGKRYYGEKVADVEEAKRFEGLLREAAQQLGVTMADFFPLLGVVEGAEKKLSELQRRRDGFMQDLVDEHRTRMVNGELMSDGGSYKTMMEVLLEMQRSDPNYYDDEIIKSLTLTLLTGGTDTSTLSIEWVMSLLLNNPECLKKAQEEIDVVVGNDHIVNDFDLPKLPYLYCIIKETMRIYPVSPLSGARECSEDCIVGGYHIPRGTILLVNIWAMQRDPTLWDEPLKFDPQRFEGHEGLRDGFRFMPFGLGRRSCPGDIMAMRTVGLTMAALLQCFDWERIGEELVDLSEATGLTMPKAQPLFTKCTPRPHMLQLLSQF